MARDPSAEDASSEVPEEALDRLFQAPLEQFTAARNQLAKELRDDGEAGAADWVKALRKPTRAAWLVNQLAGRRSESVEGLLEIGAQLRQLQEQTLAGSVDRDKLREAARREQRAIDDLVETAEVIGREHGVGAQILDRVGETLQAAAGDPELAQAIGKGRLQREQRATSLGLIGAAAPPEKGTKPTPADEAARRRRGQQAARRRRAVERTLASTETKVERERAAVEKAQGALEDRRQRLRRAEQKLADAERELKEL